MILENIVKGKCIFTDFTFKVFDFLVNTINVPLQVFVQPKCLLTDFTLIRLQIEVNKVDVGSQVSCDHK
jgi:hypothetical protein